MTTQVILVGSGGRMGKAVRSLCDEMEGIHIAYGVDPGSGTSFDACDGKADAVIDFSTASVLPSTLAFCTQHGLPLVLATTGHDANADMQIDAAADKIAILRSANLSYGAYVLSQLAKSAYAKLEGAYDVTIIETHHKHKRDAPSGTARQLADFMQAKDVPMLSVRGGGVNGIHEVLFLSEMDAITLRHDALDKRLFARGALLAAKWIAGCAPGLYGMADFAQTLDGEQH